MVGRGRSMPGPETSLFHVMQVTMVSKNSIFGNSFDHWSSIELQKLGPRLSGKLYRTRNRMSLD